MRSKIALGVFTLTLTLIPISATAGSGPVSVPGNSGNAPCSTSSNASAVAQSAVTKSAQKSCYQTGGDGRSQQTAGRSAYQIKRDFPSSLSGLYWIQNSQINNGLPIQIYADMDRDGGGWTLIVANSVNHWSYYEAQLVNQTNPPSDPKNLAVQSGKYSILIYADAIKKSASGFQYRVEGLNYGQCGGIWTSNSAYSFVSTSNGNTNISLDTNFGDWTYNNDSYEQRMPYLAPGAEGLLTTSIDPNSNWWGTIIQSGYWENKTIPLIGAGGPAECRNPDQIWYWVR